jgi:serine/threonine protein kinase
MLKGLKYLHSSSVIHRDLVSHPSMFFLYDHLYEHTLSFLLCIVRDLLETSKYFIKRRLLAESKLTLIE